ncbi:MAG: heparinase II/III family protein [Pseudomonadota bacterium]
MARLNVADRARIAGVFADGAKRSALANALASPLLRWRYSAAATGEFLIIPQVLRCPDPSFFNELRLGEVGLAGQYACSANRKNVFDIQPPSLQWQQELHGFSWLRHLEAVDEPEATELARDIVFSWLQRSATGIDSADPCEVTARRIMSWISHAPLVLDGATDHQHERYVAALGKQLAHVSATWRNAAPGANRLTCLIALCLGNLSLGGYDTQLPDAVRRLEEELVQQVIAVDGHIARNPATMVLILLDLLPLTQCFKARDIEAPDAVVRACESLLRTLRHMQLGDTGLARFHGMGPASPAELATVLAYDDLADPSRASLSPLQRNGYARLVSGDSIVVMDVGKPPPFEHSGGANAGCLSFEWSYQTFPILVNGGVPAGNNAIQVLAARSTASHNTLRLNDESSSELVKHARLSSTLGATPLRNPSNVTLHTEIFADDDHVFADPGEIEVIGLEASHDGYLERHALIHTRRIALHDQGLSLIGTDTLTGHRQTVRLSRDLPFAVHFHLHPSATARLIENGRRIEIRFANEKRARFQVTGASLGIEPGQFYAATSGPKPTQQIVLRGSTFGETQIDWSIAVDKG